MRRVAEEGLLVLRGFRPDEMRTLVSDAMEPVLKPLVYAEPLHLVARHREQGEPVYIVSATLQEVVDGLAAELGFDGGIGTVCEVGADGTYTGHSVLPLHGQGKAQAVVELAEREDIDLARSTAYSDSHTDLPFLEVVGHPVVVNPDRDLRRRARPRLGDARVQRARVSARATARAIRRSTACRSCSARSSRRGSVDAEDVEPRLRALGFGEADARSLADHFIDAEQRGKSGHGFSRVEWLATLDDLDPTAQPLREVAYPGFERWDGNGALGYLTLAAICDAQLLDPPPHARVVVARRTFPTGMLGYWVRRLAEGGLVAALTAISPRRLGHPDGGPKLTGTNPLAIAIPSSDGRPIVSDVSMGKVTYGDVIAGLADESDLVPFGGERAQGVRARGGAGAARRVARRRGLRRSARRRAAGGRSRCRRSARSPAACGYPATRRARRRVLRPGRRRRHLMRGVRRSRRASRTSCQDAGLWTIGVTPRTAACPPLGPQRRAGSASSFRTCPPSWTRDMARRGARRRSRKAYAGSAGRRGSRRSRCRCARASAKLE